MQQTDARWSRWAAAALEGSTVLSRGLTGTLLKTRCPSASRQDSTHLARRHDALMLLVGCGLMLARGGVLCAAALWRQRPPAHVGGGDQV